jgi:hypothetical protein
MDRPQRLAGTRLPEGVFILTADDQRRFAHGVGGDPAADATVNALWLITSDLRGLGTDLTHVFAMAGCDIVADGPMLGGCEMDFARPIEVDRPYRALGEILGIERKTGRRTGSFDLMRVRVSLADDDGEVAAATTSYVLPRRPA